MLGSSNRFELALDKSGLANPGVNVSRQFLILATALLIAGCAESPEENVIGVWFDTDEDVTVQFLKDGTLIVENGDSMLSRDYQILDEDRIRLGLSPSPESETASIVVEYKLSGDRLVLIAPDGDRTTMIRTEP